MRAVAVMDGPCDWDIPDPRCCPDWEEADEQGRQQARATAAYLLWAATGRQYGRCESTLRPCRRGCADGGWPPRCDGRTVVAGRWMAAIASPLSAQWGGMRCGCRSRHGCSCTTVCEVDLPGWFPEPTSVLVDGQPVPLEHFRVDNGRWLVWERPCTLPCRDCPPEAPEACDCPRTLACFPACQDLSRGPDCEGTWQITYRHGIPVPPVGLWAAAELACEVLKACTPGAVGECRLPSNVRAISRQNVDIEYVNNGNAITDGRLRFGLPNVDLWVAAVNPRGVSGPVQFYSPDVDPGRVQTYP